MKKILKEILEILAIVLILIFGAAGACAQTTKKLSLEQPKYEVKSDILNFNYQEMAYPVKTGMVGVTAQKLTDNKPATPAKRKPGKPQPKEDPFVGALTMCGYLMGITAYTMIVVSICPALIAVVIVVTLGSYYKSKKEKES